MAKTKHTDTSAANAATGGDVQSAIATMLGSADSTAAQRMQSLTLVHQARVARLTRTAASVVAQHGAGSAEASAAQADVSAAKASFARIAVASRQMTTAAPQVAANGWALHGRVVDAQLQPLAGYCVFLVDAQNAYQQAYGFSYTDSTGYFLLNYAGPPAALAKEEQQAASPVFIEVANQKAQPVFLSTSAFTPTPGSAVYQNFAIAAGAKPIGDPPAGIRKTAFPNARDKAK
ncbi:hypothetical protein SB861_40105 [Paraburkholderia sp. SIMBA_049]